MEQRKYYDRDFRSTEEKDDIGRKSDNRCCHCGKYKYTHYGATIDHFIPLDKGGCDRFINLIMMCEECNQEKGTKLVDISYVPYLKEKHKKELQEYLDSYIHTMDFVERNRILALDEYPIFVETCSPLDYGNKHKKTNKYITKKYIMKKGNFEDLDKLYNYFVKYLKKVNSLDDEVSARENLIFWLTFGSIYYLEKNNEVSLMVVLTVRHVMEDESYKTIHNIPQMYIFSYYTSNMAINLSIGLLTTLPECIIDEQGLSFLPYKLVMLENDKMVNYIHSYLKYHTNGNKQIMYDGVVNGFKESFLTVGTEFNTNYKNETELTTDGEKNLSKFMKKFDDVTDKLVKFFTKYANRVSIGWMIFDLMSHSYIQNTELYDVLFDENGQLKSTEE